MAGLAVTNQNSNLFSILFHCFIHSIHTHPFGARRSSAPCRVGYPLMSVYTKKHDLPTYPEPPGNPIYLVRKPLLTVTPTLPRPYLPIASAKRASTDTLRYPARSRGPGGRRKGGVQIAATCAMADAHLRAELARAQTNLMATPPSKPPRPRWCPPGRAWAPTMLVRKEGEMAYALSREVPDDAPGSARNTTTSTSRDELYKPQTPWVATSEAGVPLLAWQAACTPPSTPRSTSVRGASPRSVSLTGSTPAGSSGRSTPHEPPHAYADAGSPRDSPHASPRDSLHETTSGSLHSPPAQQPPSIMRTPSGRVVPL